LEPELECFVVFVSWAFAGKLIDSSFFDDHNDFRTDPDDFDSEHDFDNHNYHH
jgi:hypothetical protein